jgi:hypothetical protein
LWLKTDVTCKEDCPHPPASSPRATVYTQV